MQIYKLMMKYYNNYETSKLYNDILYPFVLSLYVLIPPRRNKDYQLMKILNDTNDNDTKYNYIDLKNNICISLLTQML